ncbi:TetR/AcrR family transcriptional regulator [Alicyclobacillus curvatus]|jgi:TetR/AcrR family transcriptional regulator, fatty acid metabolism regulator protein|nr:TetR/AcrR family transcriptional regulator [Alicyclobacillus curvatus]
MNGYSFSGEGRGIGTRRDESKYNAILDAAVLVMAEFGYHHAQIARIAKAAGVADGTVYLYFKNKEDILISVLRHTIGEIVDKATETSAKAVSAEDQLRSLVRLYFGELGVRRDLAMVTQVHLRQVDTNIRREIGDIMKPFYNLLDDMFERGVKEGIFAPSLNRRITRRLIFGTMDETVTAWVLSGAKYDLASLSNDVVDALLYGLTGRPENNTEQKG